MTLQQNTLEKTGDLRFVKGKTKNPTPEPGGQTRRHSTQKGTKKMTGTIEHFIKLREEASEAENRVHVVKGEAILALALFFFMNEGVSAYSIFDEGHESDAFLCDEDDDDGDEQSRPWVCVDWLHDLEESGLLIKIDAEDALRNEGYGYTYRLNPDPQRAAEALREYAL